MTPHSKKWDEREYRDAIDTIANEAIYRAWRNADDQWEDFPDIGENDWAEVVKHGGRICEGPELRELARAYKYLAGRNGDWQIRQGSDDA